MWHEWWEPSFGHVCPSTAICPSWANQRQSLAVWSLSEQHHLCYMWMLFVVYCVNITFMWNKLWYSALDIQLVYQNVRGERCRYQVLQRQATELVYKVISSFKHEPNTTIYIYLCASVLHSYRSVWSVQYGMCNLLARATVKPIIFSPNSFYYVPCQQAKDQEAE
jgi:hypothetical protein